MKTFEEYTNNKVIIINRGVPGAGKSFSIKKLVPAENIFSTDEFWGADYKFDASRLGVAHKWNEDRVRKAMVEGKSPIAVDNTNIKWAAIKSYYKMAKEHGYEVRYNEPDSPWWLEISKMLETDKTEENITKAAELLSTKNTHNVPIETLKNMLNSWVPTKQLPNENI